MKKNLLFIFIIASSSLFSQISFTSTKNWSGSSVSVDGNGTCGNVLPTVSFAASDFGGCSGSTYSITDVNVFIGWCKQDGTCTSPGTGNAFHNETNFCVNSPSTNTTLANSNTWSGSTALTQRMDTWFDQSAGSIPSGTPSDGTYLPNGGNLNTFNGTSPIGAWNVRPGDTGSGDPLCVNQYQIQVTATVTPPGNPATFGSNQWNVYAYNGNDYNLGGGVTYYGYYIEPLLTYDTRNRWGTSSTPAVATGYLGCDPGIDNHTVVSKRRGFPCAVYQINVTNHDDNARLYINGTSVFDHAGCCDTHTNVWTGVLGTTDEIEFRHGEGSGGSHQGLQFLDVSTSLNAGSITYSGNTSACVGYNPPAFGSSSAASGGASAVITNGSISYQWQVNGADIVGATGVNTYNPGAINTVGSYIYRRKATDKCGSVSYSNTFTINIVADPSTPTVTKSPNTTNVCAGTILTVTSPSSTGGTGTCNFEYRYSTDGGSTYTGWSTSVPSFSATGTDNRIQTRRVCSGTDCNTSGSNTQTWNVEAAPTAPTTITGTTFICAGSSTTLTASGGSDGSGATWQWYTGSCGGTLVGGATTASTTVSPSTTTTYYARRVGNTSCTSTTACASVTVTVNGSATTPSGATLPAATATATCVVNDNNWHHFYDTNGDLLASINSNNQNLGNVTITIEVGNAGPFGTGLAPGVCGYPGASGGEYALARNWDITVDNQPSSPVNVKFYYESSEVTDLTNNIATLPSNSTNYINCWGNVTSESDLMMTVSHTSGGTELFTSLSPVAGPGTGLREIAFALNEFSSGKLHANGGIHTSNPLPVELLSFEARPINNEYIKLSWTTVTEINNEGFELLRSTDGQEFEKIAWIAGNGNTTEQQTYSFNDTKVATGTYYYKLKQIDFDGESEEFNVISATINNDFATAEMTVRPIPTSNTITVDVTSVSNTNTTISVFNYAGQRVLEINKELTEGKNSLTLEEVSELSSGIYYVNLTVNDKVFTQKFVVSK